MFKRLAECSLFVCNKWDLVRETQQKDVKRYLSSRLSGCWQNANFNPQIVYISTTQAFQIQEFGGVTNEFNDLLESIEKMVLKTINTRLYSHLM